MRFAAYLRQLEGCLDIPYPQRSDLVAEIATHLDDLYSDLVSEGLDETTAKSTAIDSLSADADFIKAMCVVHQTAVARALTRLPRNISLGIEYGAITLIGFLLVFTVILQEAPMIEFLASGGFFMIPINVAGIPIVFLGIERFYSLFIKKDHSQENLEKRLLSLTFLALVCALTGVIGTLVGLYQAFSVADQIAARFDGVFPIFEVTKIAMTTSIWGMTLALIAVVVRFIAEAKLARIASVRAM